MPTRFLSFGLSMMQTGIRVLLLTVGTIANAQMPSPKSAAGPNTVLASAFAAKRILERGVVAMGGVDRLRAIKTVTRSFSATAHDPAQGVRPVPPAELDPPVIERFQVYHAVDFAARRAFARRSGAITGGQPYALRLILSPELGFQTNDSVRTIVEVPSPALANRFTGFIRQNPEAILLAALGRVETLRHLGPTTSPSGDRDLITFVDRDGELVTLAFGRRDGRLASVHSVGTGASLGDQEIVTEYSDWREAPGGALVPFTYRERRNGVLYQTLSLAELRVNEPIPDTLFSRPTGYGVESTPATATSLGGGAFVLHGAYNSMAIVFNEYVVVIEPVASEAVTRANLAFIDSVAPGKPVRHVVVTHFHSDHFAGVRGYLSRGATVLTTADAVQGIERLAVAPRNLRPDGVATVASVRSEIVSERKSLTDGEHVVELIPVGPTPHADQMLLVYLPAQGVLFEGDLLDIPVPTDGTAMGGNDTVDLLSKMGKLGLNVTTIVPVHGRIGTMSDLQRAAARVGRPSP